MGKNKYKNFIRGCEEAIEFMVNLHSKIGIKKVETSSNSPTPIQNVFLKSIKNVNVSFS